MSKYFTHAISDYRGKEADVLLFFNDEEKQDGTLAMSVVAELIDRKLAPDAVVDIDFPVKNIMEITFLNLESISDFVSKNNRLPIKTVHILNMEKKDSVVIDLDTMYDTCENAAKVMSGCQWCLETSVDNEDMKLCAIGEIIKRVLKTGNVALDDPKRYVNRKTVVAGYTYISPILTREEPFTKGLRTSDEHDFDAIEYRSETIKKGLKERERVKEFFKHECEKCLFVRECAKNSCGGCVSGDRTICKENPLFSKKCVPINVNVYSRRQSRIDSIRFCCGAYDYASKEDAYSAIVNSTTIKYTPEEFNYLTELSGYLYKGPKGTEYRLDWVTKQDKTYKVDGNKLTETTELYFLLRRQTSSWETIPIISDGEEEPVKGFMRVKDLFKYLEKINDVKMISPGKTFEEYYATKLASMHKVTDEVKALMVLAGFNSEGRRSRGWGCRAYVVAYKTVDTYASRLQDERAFKRIKIHYLQRKGSTKIAYEDSTRTSLFDFANNSKVIEGLAQKDSVLNRWHTYKRY